MRIFGALLLCSTLGQGGAQMNSIAFEPNRGQTNPETRYVGRSRCSAFLIEDSAIVFARSSPDGNSPAVFRAVHDDDIAPTSRQARWTGRPDVNICVSRGVVARIGCGSNDRYLG